MPWMAVDVLESLRTARGWVNYGPGPPRLPRRSASRHRGSARRRARAPACRGVPGLVTNTMAFGLERAPQIAKDCGFEHVVAKLWWQNDELLASRRRTWTGSSMRLTPCVSATRSSRKGSRITIDSSARSTRPERFGRPVDRVPASGLAVLPGPGDGSRRLLVPERPPLVGAASERSFDCRQLGCGGLPTRRRNPWHPRRPDRRSARNVVPQRRGSSRSSAGCHAREPEALLRGAAGHRRPLCLVPLRRLADAPDGLAARRVRGLWDESWQAKPVVELLASAL